MLNEGSEAVREFILIPVVICEYLIWLGHHKLNIGQACP